MLHLLVSELNIYQNLRCNDKKKEHRLNLVKIPGYDFFHLEEFLKMAPLCRKLQEINTFQNILIY